MAVNSPRHCCPICAEALYCSALSLTRRACEKLLLCMRHSSSSTRRAPRLRRAPRRPATPLPPPWLHPPGALTYKSTKLAPSWRLPFPLLAPAAAEPRATRAIAAELTRRPAGPMLLAQELAQHITLQAPNCIHHHLISVPNHPNPSRHRRLPFWRRLYLIGERLVESCRLELHLTANELPQPQPSASSHPNSPAPQDQPPPTWSSIAGLPGCISG